MNESKTFTFNGKQITLPRNPTHEELRQAVLLARAGRPMFSASVEHPDDPSNGSHRHVVAHPVKVRRARGITAVTPSEDVEEHGKKALRAEKKENKESKKNKEKKGMRTLRTSDHDRESEAQGMSSSQADFMTMLGCEPGSVRMGWDGKKSVLNSEGQWIEEEGDICLLDADTGGPRNYTALTLPQDIKDMALIRKQDGYILVDSQKFLVRNGEVVDCDLE